MRIEACQPVVRLRHSDAFDQEGLWRYAADFKTNSGKQLGSDGGLLRSREANPERR